MNTLEVCCGSLDSVIAAVEGGAERIELCSALSLDGLTPSIGLVREVRSLYPDLKIHVLIRPREGDFVYSEAEVRVMERDIRAAINAGATAIVSGALLPVGAVGFSSNDFTLDISTTSRLVQASMGLPFTFHRAFDLIADKATALQHLYSLGIRRILTSGGAPTAEAGIPVLQQLVQQATLLSSSTPAQSSPLPHERGQGMGLLILPGGGVSSLNARRILQETGATEIHGSCSERLSNGLRQTSADEVRAVLKAISR